MQQLVSILIPAFNVERWLKDCLESIRNQTWVRKEIILVDDGSTDATLDIARSYASSDVLVLTQENRGASAARNHALSKAQGDYIQWMDADDILLPDKIASQMEFAEPGHGSRVLLSGSWGRFYCCPEKARYAPSPLWEDLQPTEWLFRKIDTGHWMAPESWLVSRWLTDRAGLWNERLYRDNDGDYFNRVIAESDGIRFVSGSRSLHRVGVFNSISFNRNLDDRKLESLLTSARAQIRLLRSMEDSSRTRSAALKLLRRWSIFFFPERMDLFQQLKDTAVELGGELEEPRLRSKYHWLRPIVGWKSAKKLQNTAPMLRSLIEKNRERVSCRKLSDRAGTKQRNASTKAHLSDSLRPE